MSICPWQSIHDFRSRGEFDHFQTWMAEQIAKGNAVQVPVTAPYLGASSFSEKWFKHIPSRCIWRLVWPDGPFTGIFDQV